jgi:type I restriction enzyme, S subunit
VTDLPTGWAVATLADLIDAGGIFVDGDWVESKDQDPDGEVRLVQLADVGEGVFRDRSKRRLTQLKASELRCTQLKPGDILVARMPEPLGRACVYPGGPTAAVTVVDVVVLRVNRVDSRWLMWVLNSPQVREQVLAYESGTTRKRISRRNLAKVRIGVPPLAEQRRIVAVLEDLLFRVDAASSAVNSAKVRLRGLRSSLLRNWFEGAGNELSECPLAPLGQVAKIAGGQTPRGISDFLRSEPWVGSVPYVKVGDMNAGDGVRVAASRTYIARAEAVKHGMRVWPMGTLLLPKRGGAIATNKKRMLARESALDLNVMGVVPSENLLPSYLWCWFEQVNLAALADGSNVPQLNYGDLAYLTLPVPPIPVQQRVADAIETQLSGIARLMGSLNSISPARLRISLLREAFGGRLVSQDPDDEPASELLARIKAERAATIPKQRARSRRTPKELPAPPTRVTGDDYQQEALPL